MRKFYLLFSLLLTCTLLQAQQALPSFSTDGSDAWYYIRFKNAGAILSDQGEKAKVKTVNLKRNADEQLWKFVGTQGNVEIINKTGRKLYFDNSISRFATSASEKAALKIFATSNQGYQPGWEIAPINEDARAMNQFGGAGVGKELALWNKGDMNNPLEFIAQADMEFPDEAPQTLAEYKYAFSNFRPKNINTMWYIFPVTSPPATEPSGNTWMEYALPIGNGELGAMVYAGIHQDILQFNEKTLWTGSPTKYGQYRNFGHLYMEDLDNLSTTDVTKGAKSYNRYLDLETATAGMTYKSTDLKTTFTREYISSNPDKVIAIHMKAEGTGKINQKFYLFNANGTTAKYTADGLGKFGGKLDLVSFAARLKVVPTGGTMTADASGITVKGADEVLILLAAGTNYDSKQDSYISDAAALPQTIEGRVQDAAKKSWDQIYKAHQDDYTALFGRVKFQLAGAANTRNTVNLVKNYANSNRTGTEPHVLMLEQLYFNYGRYMLIASSRGMDLPNNLQGIWNNSNNPPWSSDIHSNINIQMNYWPAEPTNLSELHLPFLNYIYDQGIVHKEWQQNARNSGQSKGWVTYTENNIFGGSGGFMHNYVIANAWYCSHLWQHYRYTLDRDFLKKTAMPLLKSTAQYWLERLVKAQDGTYEAPNEYSPEHGPSENATAHAQQLIWDLFNSTTKAIEILGEKDANVDAAFIADLQDKFTNLDTGLATEEKNGKTILREWKYSPWSRGENGHRHMSHLMALYPLSQIKPGTEYFRAAVNSLADRGDASTGWSMGWKINLWARALDGNHAHLILKNALRHSTSYGTDQSRGGIYYNLFDSHAPFQIDGNFGATSGIAEMLLQSQHDTLSILPALPRVWKEGSITGLCATNGFEVDIYWNEGKLLNADITSKAGAPCIISYPGVAKATFTTKAGTKLQPTVINDNTVSLPTTAGDVLNVDMTNGTSSIAQTLSSTGIQIENRTIQVADNNTTISLYDLQGRTLLKATTASYTVPQAWGDSFVLKVAKNGQKPFSKTITLP